MLAERVRDGSIKMRHVAESCTERGFERGLPWFPYLSRLNRQKTGPRIVELTNSARLMQKKLRDSNRSEIEIAEVTFIGSLQLPVPEQEEIAAPIKQRTHGCVLEGVISEAVERARDGWMNHGYFKLQISGNAKTLSSSPRLQRIVVDILVEEGQRYTLSGIKFKGNRR